MSKPFCSSSSKRERLSLSEQTRLISFANNTIAMTYEGDLPTYIVDFLYRYVSPATLTPPHLTYRLLPAGMPGQVRLYQGETLRVEDSPEVVAELLLGESCYHLADQSQAGLLFHAAGLAKAGAGLLLPGQTGTGKSTLTSWLLAQRFDYLTDELIFIPEGTQIMQPLTRPLNLKRPARKVLAPLFDFAAQAANIISSPRVDLIPPTLFNPSIPLPQACLSLIIFPHYQPAGEFTLLPLSRAQAGLELMRCLINARNLAGYGFSEVTRLVKDIPAYKMNYTRFEQIGEQVTALLRRQETPFSH